VCYCLARAATDLNAELLAPSSTAPQDKVKKRKPAFEIPDIREYFVDLEYVLGVIAHGPTKSFAFRRLKYLDSKFTMYALLNESQEMADMKVRFCLSFCMVRLTTSLESASSVCLHERCLKVH